MKQSIDVADALVEREGGLLLPAFSNRRLPAPVRALDRACDGRLSAQLRLSGFSAARGESRLLLDLPGIAADRVLVIGCGRRSALDARRFRSIAAHAARELAAVGGGRFSSALALVSVKRRDRFWRLRQTVRAVESAGYRFRMPGADPDDARARPALDALVHLVVDEATRDRATEALHEALAIARGETIARDLGNRPPADCTPLALAAAATSLAERYDTIETEVLDRDAMARDGMGGVLAVARGSAAPPTFSIVRYRHPDASGAPVVLVGKGVTFDSGGLSIKTASGMQYMKLDMAGAAAVLGALEAVALLGLPLDVVALLPAVENLPGPEALRPGDVIRMRSGRRVEVLNTDAEGRLILADALDYAKRFEPAAVVDVATLTGAAVGALGRHLSALFCNDRSLERALLGAGRAAHDRAWPMPLLPEYRSVLESKVADLANVGGSSAGATVAACFLERFAGSLTWAHLDIAGVAGKDGVASGRPVALLAHWLIARATSTAAVDDHASGAAA